MIFIASLFFLHSCSFISKYPKEDGMYSVPDYDMYWHEKYIVDNDIITFQNFHVKDSIYLYDSYPWCIYAMSTFKLFIFLI